MSETRRVPALIVSGYLGSGKTTLVQHLLEDAQREGVRLAIVSNEFGDTGIDRALLDAGEDVGLATIYRVLTQFEQAGLVQRHNFEGGHSVFELDGGEHHDHMVCVKTGKVVEFYDEVIEQRQREIAEKHGWKMTDHSLVIYGVSPEAEDD